MAVVSPTDSYLCLERGPRRVPCLLHSRTSPPSRTARACSLENDCRVQQFPRCVAVFIPWTSTRWSRTITHGYLSPIRNNEGSGKHRTTPPLIKSVIREVCDRLLDLLNGTAD